MPQDQDDIKGANAMKQALASRDEDQKAAIESGCDIYLAVDPYLQAPTPGPLSGDDVKLLVKGDLLRGPDGVHEVHRVWASGIALADGEFTLSEFEAARFAFIGRPGDDGWMPWPGGENPVGDAPVEVKLRNGCTSTEVGADINWSHSFDNREAVAFDIIAFRLAPTAPVEASGSEREKVADLIKEYVTGPPFTDADLIEAQSRDRLIAADKIISHLCPQPSGETREQVASDDLRLAVATVIDRMAFSDSHEPAGEERRKTWLANKKARIERAIARADEAIDLVERSKPTDERSAVLINTIKTELLGVQPDSQGVVLEDDDWRLILNVLIRPAPVASGGQHSSGEGLRLDRLRDWINREVPAGTESATWWVRQIDAALTRANPLPDDLRTACQAALDDYQTSNAHHPDHVLIRRTDFERIKALVEAPVSTRAEALSELAAMDGETMDLPPVAETAGEARIVPQHSLEIALSLIKTAFPDELYLIEALSTAPFATTPTPVAETAGEAVAYGADHQPWCQPGDQTDRAFRLRFEDPDMREMIWTGPDAEKEALAAYNQYAPAWNVYLFSGHPRATPPVPAQDDDRGMKAFNFINDLYRIKAVFPAIRLHGALKKAEALAALKSTAAQEGGES